MQTVDTGADLPGDTSPRPVFQEGRNCALLGLHESRLQLRPGFWEVAVTRDAGRTEQDHTARRLIMSSTCEMFGCRRKAHKLYSLAPGTNLWLCKSCAETEGLERAQR